MNYYNKYNKYKNKYLFLKYNLTGASIDDKYSERKKYIINELISKNFQIMLQKIQIILYNYYRYKDDDNDIQNKNIYLHLKNNSNSIVNNLDHAYNCDICLKWDENIKLSTIKTHLLDTNTNLTYLNKIKDENILNIINLIKNNDNIDNIFKYNIKLNIILYFITLINPIFKESDTHKNNLEKISKILNDYLIELNKFNSKNFNKDQKLNELLGEGVNTSLFHDYE
jgi:hypothetical protein